MGRIKYRWRQYFEIHGPDEQPAPLAVLSRDRLDLVGSDVLGDQCLERRGVGHRIAEGGGDHVALLDDVVRGDRRVERFQLFVVLGTEKSEAGGQCSGADPGDHGELGTGSGSGPAH